jgi:hypothetical protein
MRDSEHSLKDAMMIMIHTHIYYRNPGLTERNVQINGKEVVELFRILAVLAKVLTHLPDKISTGWHKHSIIEILQSLLNSLNHVKLRLEGFRLLLLFLNVYETADASTGNGTDALQLYASALDLTVFDSFPLPAPHDWAKSDGTGSDGVPGLQKHLEGSSSLSVPSCVVSSISDASNQPAGVSQGGGPGK